LTEKTWVYWLGLLIMALSIVGLIGEVSALVLPGIPARAEAARVAGMWTRFAITRLPELLGLLAVGIYMMISGRVKK